jgi:hypothetical protein
MSIFSFFNLGNTASATGGVAVGASLMHIFHHFTTGKQLKSLEERLGDTPIETQERAIKKIGILKTLAYKDGEFSTKEQLFLYRYILNCPDLPSDLKVELALQLQEPLPKKLGNLWEKVRSLADFSSLFKTEEEMAGFISTMFSLVKLDDDTVDAEEISYIKTICIDCKIPLYLLPKL